jgi:hypothetical protein
MIAWLARHCERGLIQLDDPETASGILRGMMILEPHRAALLRQRAAPDASEIAGRAKSCVRIFLRGRQV